MSNLTGILASHYYAYRIQVVSFQTVASFVSFNRMWSRGRSAAGTLFTNLLAVFFYIGTRVVFHIQVQGLHNFTVSPSTIIAISHKRDLDEIIIPSNNDGVMLYISRRCFFEVFFCNNIDIISINFLI